VRHITRMLYFSEIARYHLNHRGLNFVICNNHHYEYENDEQTGYSRVAGCYGSFPDGEGIGIHPGDSAERLTEGLQKQQKTSDGADQKGSPTFAGLEAWILEHPKVTVWARESVLMTLLLPSNQGSSSGFSSESRQNQNPDSFRRQDSLARSSS